MLNYIIRQTDIYLKSKSREVIKMLKRLAKELCVYILAGVVIWFCIITISGGESVKLGISEAVDRCMNIIIPSLFVFMALSQILVSSGLYYCVSMPFYPISRFIMGIPPQLFFVFFLRQLRILFRDCSLCHGQNRKAFFLAIPQAILWE